MRGEQTILKVGIGAMGVAAAFTLLAAVVLALRDEPERVPAPERAVLTAEREPVRTAHTPGSLPRPERPELAPVLERRETADPNARPPRPTGQRPGPERRANPHQETRQRAASDRTPQSGAKPEPELAREAPQAGKAQRSGPQRVEPEKAKPEKAKPRKAEPEKAEPRKAEPRKAEPRRPDRNVRAERSRPAAGEPRRSGFPGGAVMTLSIEALGLRDVPVRKSGSDRALDNGVIHLPSTSLPWDETAGGRNVYLVGHRLGYPGTGSHRIFNRLGELSEGDEIVVEDRRGRAYEYRVTSSRVVWPSDSWVKDPVPGRDLLSLQTCTPIPSFEKRLIVRANRV